MSAAKPVAVITSNDLKQNGGAYVLEGGKATPVAAVDPATTTSKIIGGTRTPVYVVGSSAPRKEGTPVEVINYDTGRGIEGRVAKPVYLVSGTL